MAQSRDDWEKENANAIERARFNNEPKPRPIHSLDKLYRKQKFNASRFTGKKKLSIKPGSKRDKLDIAFSRVNADER